jgi:hypothetical protein
LPEGLGNMPALVYSTMGPPDCIPALRGWGSSIVVSLSMSAHVVVVLLCLPVAIATPYLKEAVAIVVLKKKKSSSQHIIVSNFGK